MTRPTATFPTKPYRKTSPQARLRRRVAGFVGGAACLLGMLASPHASVAQNLPSGFAEFQVAAFGSNALPTDLAFAPDGRIFVCQKYGQLRVVKNGTLLPTPFLSLTVNGANERGLLGIAFDPSFASNGYIYVYYTPATTPIHNRISRFTADPNNPDVALAGSEFVLMELDNVSTSYHNAGDLHFGPDGKLYVNVGNDTVGAYSASLDNRFGKVLRINSDGSIPSDNPFYNNSSVVGANKSIWAYGLRNPFKSAIQPGTGRVFIMDVGEEHWEEINDGIPGANYGWPSHEGASNSPGFTSPIFAYAHGDGDAAGRAITGGTFYNPPGNATSPFPSSYVGKFFYGDYVNGWVRLFDPSAKTNVLFANSLAPGLVDLEVGPDGSLYYLTISAEEPMKAAIYRITNTGLQSPQIGTQPAPRTVASGQTATFTLRVSGDQPMTFQWQKNGADIAGATDQSYTTPPTVIADSGSTFTCVVTNAYGTATTTPATLTVNENAAPVPTISGPLADSLYTAGDTIFFSGTATDREDGTLGANSFTWQVDFHHHTHAHPGFLPATTGIKSGTFNIANSGETSEDTWYRIYLTVTDSSGLSATTYREIFPRKSTVTLASNPPGLKLTLDGQPLTAPGSILGVAGLQRPIGAVSPQTVNGVTWQFESWSDGGAGKHSLTWPVADTTYTAVFRDSSTVTNGSEFISQSVPTSMYAGNIYPVSVSFKNTGNAIWPAGSDYRLGAINPYDNFTWGSHRVQLSAPVLPGETATFTYNAIAPSVVGTYNFQWRMVQESRQWFGQATPNVSITVAQSPNNAEFIAQSVPTSMVGGQMYYVAVTMKNTGTSTWPANSTFALNSQNPRDNVNWGGTRVAVSSNVRPGENYTFNFAVIAPSTTAGLFNFQWQMLDEANGLFGQMSANVGVNVSTAANAATFVTHAVPTYMAAGRGYDIKITMKNTGTNSWPGFSAYRLMSQNPRDNFTWGINRVNLPATVLPGNSIMIPFNVVAPTAPGIYNMQWQMVQDGVANFGEYTPNVAVHVGVGPTITSQPASVRVLPGEGATFSVTASGDGPLNYQWQRNSINIPGANAPSYTTPPASASDNNASFRCIVSNIYGNQFSNAATLTVAQPNDAQFISQSVPASMVAGQQYTVSVTMKNSGSDTWSAGAGYRLGSQNPDNNIAWGFNRVLLPSDVAPGATVTFNFALTAPWSGGTTNFQWRMLRENVAWFGERSTNVPVNVSTIPNSAVFVSQTVPTSMVANSKYNVSITFKNTGTNTWTQASRYRLGYWNPRDSTMWGSARVSLPASVAPGASVTFNFTVTAPKTAGQYPFQWRMVQDGVQWFGATTTNLTIAVQ